MSLSNPFIPKGKAKYAVVDGRAENDIVKAIENLGVKVIPTIKCNNVHDAISYHPDIVMHPINHNTLIIEPSVYDYYAEIFCNTSIKVIKGETILQRNYPYDIAYNVARVQGYAIHNTKYMDEKLKFYLVKENIDFIDVKQGYTKCSIAIVGESSLITSNKSIYMKSTEHCIDTLLIQEGHIELPGFDHGFIGGATGCFSERKVFITGELKDHPDKDKIHNFIKKQGKIPIVLSNKKIIDIGSIITFN